MTEWTGRASSRAQRRAARSGAGWSMGAAVSWAISDAGVLAGRNLVHIRRVRQLWPFMVVQPMVFVLLFALVFGGAIPLPGGGSYREFLLSGVFAQAVSFIAYPAALGIAFDAHLGLLDRFRTLPIHPSAIFVGRTIGDLGRLSVSLTVMAGCGLAVGWRINDGPVRAVAGFALLALFGYAMSWVGVYLGLAAKSLQSAQSTPIMWLFPLVFLSGAFVPAASMPEPLETIATWNPVSSVAGATRELFGNPNPFADPSSFPAQHPVLLTVLWSVGLILAAAVLCTRRMRAAAA